MYETDCSPKCITLQPTTVLLSWDLFTLLSLGLKQDYFNWKLQLNRNYSLQVSAAFVHSSRPPYIFDNVSSCLWTSLGSFDGIKSFVLPPLAFSSCLLCHHCSRHYVPLLLLNQPIHLLWWTAEALLQVHLIDKGKILVYSCSWVKLVLVCQYIVKWNILFQEQYAN